MSRGIKYTPRRIKCCATCKYLIPPGEPCTEDGDNITTLSILAQMLDAYQCPKAGRWWSNCNNEPPQDRCSMHKFKDKSLIR